MASFFVGVVVGMLCWGLDFDAEDLPIHTVLAYKAFLCLIWMEEGLTNYQNLNEMALDPHPIRTPESGAGVHTVSRADPDDRPLGQHYHPYLPA